MASSLLALLDDITTVLDDVSVMAKVAAKKTAGVLGDDLALNAEQVAGVVAERELPIVWAVAKGSFVNKLILVPSALLISAFAPWLITPLLMVGGSFLCFEGFEKLSHKFLHRKEDETHEEEIDQAVVDNSIDMVSFEKEKIKGAIRTDFILSAEIVVISLGTVSEAAFLQRVGVLSVIAVVMTVGVYGLVGAIVKMDDAGFYLRKKNYRILQLIGNGLLSLAPMLMKGLTIAGTAAMFLVGGGIIAHGIHAIEEFAQTTFSPVLIHLLVGVLVGAVVLAGVTAFSFLLKKSKGR